MSTACNTSLVLLKLLSHVISLPSYALFTERIDNKLLSLTYKVLTTTQPPYLHNLISTQRPRSTRSSSVVTLARPPSSSFLKNNCLLLPLCFTLSLESTPFISSSTLFWYQFLHFQFTYSFTHHFFLFRFTTLLSHNSLSLSPPA